MNPHPPPFSYRRGLDPAGQGAEVRVGRPAGLVQGDARRRPGGCRFGRLLRFNSGRHVPGSFCPGGEDGPRDRGPFRVGAGFSELGRRARDAPRGRAVLGPGPLVHRARVLEVSQDGVPTGFSSPSSGQARGLRGGGDGHGWVDG